MITRLLRFLLLSLLLIVFLAGLYVVLWIYFDPSRSISERRTYDTIVLYIAIVDSHADANRYVYKDDIEEVCDMVRDFPATHNDFAVHETNEFIVTYIESSGQKYQYLYVDKLSRRVLRGERLESAMESRSVKSF